MDDIHFQHPLLTKEEEAALAKRIQRGDKAARERLILSNLLWAKKVSEKYAKIGYRKGLTHDEVFALACEGLLRAADNFNPAKGRFSTYSTYWMQQCILRGFDQNTLIHVPLWVSQQIRNQDNGKPTVIKSSALDNLTAGRAAKLRPSQLNINVDYTADSLADPTCPNPLDVLLSRESEEEKVGGLPPYLTKLLQTQLNDRERFVIWNYTLANPRLNYEEIGVILGVTKSRAQQIGSTAIHKLRNALTHMNAA